jgi:hypothetical protein
MKLSAKDLKITMLNTFKEMKNFGNFSKEVKIIKTGNSGTIKYNNQTRISWLELTSEKTEQKES